MIDRNLEIFELNPNTDDPRFEGFSLDPAPSILGNESLDDDLTPGFGVADDNPNWKQPRLGSNWKPPTAQGRVAGFNDYPCVDMMLPAFSERAINGLHDLLKPNGEILPLETRTDARYFIYNVVSVSDALDKDGSECEFWRDPPTTTTDIDFFSFDVSKIRNHAIFRLRELPMSLFVTREFVEKVETLGLQGFDFTKVWPLPRGTNWRTKTENEKTEIEQLRQNTLVLVLDTSGVTDSDRRIENFEYEVDSLLQPSTLNEEYFGVYEGHDQFADEYRMFLSCPDPDRLLGHLLPKIRGLNWPNEIKAYRRYGRIHQTNVKEEITSIT
jgi:hypothetical protein